MLRLGLTKTPPLSCGTTQFTQIVTELLGFSGPVPESITSKIKPYTYGHVRSRAEHTLTKSIVLQTLKLETVLAYILCVEADGQEEQELST